jgi:hypothetical protein
VWHSRALSPRTRRLPVNEATTRDAPSLVAGSEKAAAHRLGLTHSTVKHHLANARSKVGAETTAQLVWILGPRLPEPVRPDDPLLDPIPASASSRAGSGASNRT